MAPYGGAAHGGLGGRRRPAGQTGRGSAYARVGGGVEAHRKRRSGQAAEEKCGCY
jgi:hypothetical protein